MQLRRTEIFDSSVFVSGTEMRWRSGPFEEFAVLHRGGSFVEPNLHDTVGTADEVGRIPSSERVELVRTPLDRGEDRQR